MIKPKVKNMTKLGFSGGSVVKNLPASVEEASSLPRLGNPTCLEATKPMYHSD